MPSVGILGGTFDPIHNAHLAMARAALRELALERVLFIPTGHPKYRTPAVAPEADRIAMLRLALAADPRFALDERELAPEATGYTADTLAALRRELGAQARLYLLLGADQYAKLDTWDRPNEVRRLAQLAVFARPGIRLQEGVPLIPMPPLDVSASEVRARAARGADIRSLVPPAVSDYISRRRLYA